MTNHVCEMSFDSPLKHILYINIHRYFVCYRGTQSFTLSLVWIGRLTRGRFFQTRIGGYCQNCQNSRQHCQHCWNKTRRQVPPRWLNERTMKVKPSVLVCDRCGSEQREGGPPRSAEAVARSGRHAPQDRRSLPGLRQGFHRVVGRSKGEAGTGGRGGRSK